MKISRVSKANRQSSLLSILTLGIVLLLSACGGEGGSKPAPDVSDIDVEVEVIRYDELLSEMDADKPEHSYLKLVTQHPRITDLYFKELMMLHKADTEAFYPDLSAFIAEPRITALEDTIAHFYPYDTDLTEGFVLPMKYLKYYFPDYSLPVFYTLFTEFSYQNFIFENKDNRNGVGIGLDYFLGKDFEYKKIDPGNAVFSSYLSRTYTKEYMVKKATEMVVLDLLGSPPGKRFIDQMIFQGKKTFILERLMPATPDTILWEYTTPQMDWIQDNEMEIWSFFLEHELMYETSHLKIANYLEPAPNSKGMPEAAPGRTGTYIGYKIVDSYMRRNPKASLEDLIQMRDSQKLLESARYKPARK